MLTKSGAITVICLTLTCVRAQAQVAQPAGSTRVAGDRLELMCALPQPRLLVPVGCVVPGSTEQKLQGFTNSSDDQPSRAPYVIAGGIVGAVVGGLIFLHSTSNCNDWCLPEGFAVIPAAVGALGGMAVGWAVSHIIYPEKNSSSRISSAGA